jgi:RNA polymerase sigma-70 factor (ECF subfamily)
LQPKFCTFEQVVLPHLDAAYNLARWLTRREHDAEDVVQESYLRALNAFEQFHGGDARCWLLTIVRNTCYTWLARNRQRVPAASFDEALHDMPSSEFDPQLILQQQIDSAALKTAIENLPVEFREVLILREFEGLSYQQVASVAQLPVGTVMSRLARARARLAEALGARGEKEVAHGLP